MNIASHTHAHRTTHTRSDDRIHCSDTKTLRHSHTAFEPFFSLKRKKALLRGKRLKKRKKALSRGKRLKKIRAPRHPSGGPAGQFSRSKKVPPPRLCPAKMRGGSGRPRRDAWTGSAGVSHTHKHMHMMIVLHHVVFHSHEQSALLPHMNKVLCSCACMGYYAGAVQGVRR